MVTVSHSAVRVLTENQNKFHSPPSKYFDLHIQRQSVCGLVV